MSGGRRTGCSRGKGRCMDREVLVEIIITLFTLMHDKIIAFFHSSGTFL